MSTETVLRSSGVYTTVLGALNQFQALTDLEYNAMHTTTLNYKYSTSEHVHESAQILRSSVVDLEIPPTTPALSYFGIGVRGFVNVGDYSSVAYPGDARMMDLYMPVPIRCVRVDEEGTTKFTNSDRAKYRLRVVRTVNGVEYACYYLKLISFDKSISIIGKDISGRETPYPLDEKWLKPTTPAINEVGGRIDTNVNRLIVRASGVCEIRHDEIIEAVNALYNGDTNYAKVSEIGYYTGCDIDVTDEWIPTSDAAAAVYKEAAFVQLAKGHCFRGSELVTPGSYIRPVVTLESESCINGDLA